MTPYQIIAYEDGGGFLLVFPDGSLTQVFTKAEAAAAAVRWISKHEKTSTERPPAFEITFYSRQGQEAAQA